MDAPIFVVVSAYGAPPDCTREDGSRYGPIVWETDLDRATLAQAQERAARCQRSGHGACRIGRVVFDDVPQPAAAPAPPAEPQREASPALPF